MYLNFAVSDGDLQFLNTTNELRVDFAAPITKIRSSRAQQVPHRGTICLSPIHRCPAEHYIPAAWKRSPNPVHVLLSFVTHREFLEATNPPECTMEARRLCLFLVRAMAAMQYHTAT
jgi:hypothetical protein